MDFEKLAKYLSGEMTWQEKEKFLPELVNDPACLDEFAGIKNLLAVTKTHTAGKKMVREEWRFFNKHTIRRGKSYVWQRVAVVALLMGIVGIMSYFMGRQSIEEPPVAYTTLSVPSGQYAQAVLPDGSEIWLNSKSSLTYPDRFASGKREVHLNGEGFFKVMSDKEHPFTVITKDLEVVATGTQFNVSAYDNDTWTSANLIEGTIFLYSEQNKISRKIKEGESATFNKELNKMYVKISDINEISWIGGEFCFREMSLEDIAKRLERNFNVKIVFNDQMLKNRRLTGTFYPHQSIENILKSVQTSLKQMSYRIDRDTVYIGNPVTKNKYNKY